MQDVHTGAAMCVWCAGACLASTFYLAAIACCAVKVMLTLTLTAGWWLASALL